MLGSPFPDVEIPGAPLGDFVLARGEMPGTVGRTVPNTECRIVNVATGEDAPVGEPGELWIRGPQ